MKEKDVPKLCTWNAEKEEWHCKKCGSLIMGKRQILSLHVKGTLMGFGETVRKIVPYCPQCEKEPPCLGITDYGSEDDPDVQDLRVIKKMGEQL